MSEFETEVTRTTLGWTYRLFFEGERVTAFPLVMKLYGTRDQAIEAAKRDAREVREMRKPSRVPIEP